MVPELKELEPRLKQILYGCVEHIQATKAALYLAASLDFNEKNFEVVTSYQFNDAQRKVISANDDLVDALAVKRAPFFVNGLNTEMKYAEMLFRQGTDRILAMPLFARGRLIGLIDMRDKAGKKPFDRADLAASTQIADEMLAVLSEKSLFGLAPARNIDEPAPDIRKIAELPLRPVTQETLKPKTVETPRPPTVEIPLPPIPAPQQTTSRGGPASVNALRAISSAREQMTRQKQTPIRRRNADRDLEVFKLVLPTAIAIPGAALAWLTVVDGNRVSHALASAVRVTDDAVDLVFAHVQKLIRRPVQETARPKVSYPVGAQPLSVSASMITTIQSAPLEAKTLEGIALTVAFHRVSEADGQRALAAFIQQMEPTIRSAALATVVHTDRETLAYRLVEPDFEKFPELSDHQRQVSAIAHRFAVALELPPTQVETVRIAALVHDVGMRLLDYEDLYKGGKPSPEQLRVLAEHPIVGAALVSPILGAEVAQIVLRHHERIDGTGYPSKLAGNQIPVGARIIALADAWVSMTSPSSYKETLLPGDAIARIQEGSGTQFDGELVPRFVSLVSQMPR